jgi:C-terminal processing protease CtpA/Prc
VELYAEGSRGLGIDVVQDQPSDTEDTVIFVSALDPLGAAATDGCLRVGDQIVQVNGTSFVNLPLETAKRLLRQPEDGLVYSMIIRAIPPKPLGSQPQRRQSRLKLRSSSTQSGLMDRRFTRKGSRRQIRQVIFSSVHDGE